MYILKSNNDKYIKKLDFYRGMEWIEWKGKRIFVKLKSGDVYSGIVIDVENDGNDDFYLSMIDKYNAKVIFLTSEIIKIREEEV